MKNEDGIFDVYFFMWKIFNLKNIQIIIVVYLIVKIGFQVNDVVIFFKFLDKGFGISNMVFIVFIDFFFEIGFGYYVGKWFQQFIFMCFWFWGFVGCFVVVFVVQFIVLVFFVFGIVILIYFFMVIF